MNPSMLSPRDRRALTIGAALGIPVLLFSLVLRPAFTSYSETRERTRVQRALLANDLAQARQVRGYPALLKGAEVSLRREAPRLFRDQAGGGPAAAFEEYVADRAEQSRVRLEQSQGREEDAAAEGVQGLDVEVQGTGDLAAILGFIRTLDTGPKLVRVERLAIEGRAGGMDASGSTPLSFSATLRGFSLRAPAASAVPAERR